MCVCVCVQRAIIGAVEGFIYEQSEAAAILQHGRVH
jgi:hypothetical protein